MKLVRLADQAHRRRPRVQHRRQHVVVRRRPPRALGHPERRHPRARELRRRLEEPAVRRIGPRPPALDIVDAELVERPRDPRLVLERSPPACCPSRHGRASERARRWRSSATGSHSQSEPSPRHRSPHPSAPEPTPTPAPPFLTISGPPKIAPRGGGGHIATAPSANARAQRPPVLEASRHPISPVANLRGVSITRRKPVPHRAEIGSCAPEPRNRLPRSDIRSVHRSALLHSHLPTSIGSPDFANR